MLTSHETRSSDNILKKKLFLILPIASNLYKSDFRDPCKTSQALHTPLTYKHPQEMTSRQAAESQKARADQSFDGIILSFHTLRAACCT